MPMLKDLSREQLEARLRALQAEYGAACAKGLKLDMSRGKPGPEQLDLTMDMLTCVDVRSGCRMADGADVRNYGLLDGIPEAKKLFADILEMAPENVIVGGNSSLNLMFDYIAQAYSRGVSAGKGKIPLPGAGL